MTLPYAIQLLTNTRFRCEEIAQHLQFGSPQIAEDAILVALDTLRQIHFAMQAHEFPVTRWAREAEKEGKT